MRKKWSVWLLISFFALSFGQCGRSPAQLDVSDVQALLSRINSSPFGIKIRAADSSLASERYPGQRGHYLVHLKNPEMSFNTAAYKQVNLPIPEMIIPFEAEEVTLVYGPEDNTCGFLEAKNFSLSLEASKILAGLEPKSGEESKPLPNLNISYRFGTINFDNYDISALLDAENSGFLDVMGKILASNPNIEYSFRDMSFEFAKEDLSHNFKLSIASGGNRAAFTPDFVTAYFNTAITGESFAQSLKEGKALIDLTGQMEKMQVSYKQPGQEVEAALNSMGVTYFLKPDEKKEFFNFAFEIDLGALDVKGLKRADLEYLLGINTMHFHVGLERISPGLIERYLDLIRTAQSAGSSQDPQALQQQMGAKGLALVGVFMQAKPILTISVSPLETKLGNLAVDGKFHFTRMGPPVGKATIRIDDFNGLEERLKTLETLPQMDVQEFMTKLKSVFVIEEGGAGTLTFELKEDDPAHFYLNGNPQSFSGIGK